MRRITILEGAVIGVLVGLTFAFAGTAVKDGASVSSTPSSSYHRQNASSDTVVPTSPEYPLPVSNRESASSWSTLRNNVVANDTTTTYGTGDAGNMTVEGYKKVRFRIFMNSTTDSCSFQCGTATPTTNPYYGFTAKTTITGYSTTSPFICDCDTNGQTVMFPKITDLSSGGNVTSIKAQAYN